MAAHELVIHKRHKAFSSALIPRTKNEATELPSTFLASRDLEAKFAKRSRLHCS